MLLWWPKAARVPARPLIGPTLGGGGASMPERASPERTDAADARLDRVPDIFVALKLIGEGRFDEAAAVHRRSLQDDPTDSLAHFDLGVALRWKGDHQVALREFGEAVRLNPDFMAAHYILGELQCERG